MAGADTKILGTTTVQVDGAVSVPGPVEVEQANPADLKATVTQAGAIDASAATVPVQEQTNPLPVSIAASLRIADRAGREPLVSEFGELIIGQRATDVQVQFQYNIATADVTDNSANGGAVTQSNSQAVLASGVGATGKASVESVDAIRYRPGHAGMAFFTAAWVTGGTAGAKQYIGPFDADDGFFVGFDGTGFVVGRRRSTVDTTVAQAAFSIDVLDGAGASGINFSAVSGNLNVFAISYGWLGAAPITFWILSPAGVWFPFHRIEYPGTATTPHIDNPVLPIAADITKTSGATDIDMRTCSWFGGSVGAEGEAGDRSFATNNEKAIGGAAETNILTLQSVATFQAKTNRVKTQCVSVSINSEGAKPVTVRIRRDATLGGSPSYTNIDATNSTLQVDIAGTTASGGTVEEVIRLAKADGQTVDLTSMFIFIRPGDTLTFSAESSQASDVGVSIRWKELF